MRLPGTGVTGNEAELANLTVPGLGKSTVAFRLGAQVRGTYGSELILSGRRVSNAVRVEFTLTVGKNEASELKDALAATQAARWQYRTIGLEGAENLFQSANQAFRSADYENAVRLATQARVTAERALGYWLFIFPIVLLVAAYLLMRKKGRRRDSIPS